MAYTFHSRATADLIMLKGTAEQILKILDKPRGEPGIITVEQIPQAIADLEQAVAEDEQRRRAIEEEIRSGTEQDSAAAAAASTGLTTGVTTGSEACTASAAGSCCTIALPQLLQKFMGVSDVLLQLGQIYILSPPFQIL